MQDLAAMCGIYLVASEGTTLAPPWFMSRRKAEKKGKKKVVYTACGKGE